MSKVKLSLVAIAMVCYLFVSGSGHVFAHCPAEGLLAWGTQYIDPDDPMDPGISGSVYAGNLTYWPRTGEQPFWLAYISSDHSVYAHHYYEDEDFTLYWSFRLSVDEHPNTYQSNPRYSGSLGLYVPDTQAMPDSISESETLWVDVTNLPTGANGRLYHMSAYTRLDAWSDEAAGKFSWKDCQNGISFLHTPPPRN